MIDEIRPLFKPVRKDISRNIEATFLLTATDVMELSSKFEVNFTFLK